MHSLVDASGTAHSPAGRAARIVSLVPSLTELLFALGLGHQVVGRTAFCTQPADRVRAIPSIGGTKQVNFAKIARLAPSHAIVNIDETPQALAGQLTTMGITVVVTHPLTVADNFPLYALLGELFGRTAEADRLARALRAGLDRLGLRTWPPIPVLYLIWKDPWMTVAPSTYIADALAHIGWRIVALPDSRRYPMVELRDELLTRVDRVLFASEPFPFKARHVEAFRRAFPAHARKARAVDGAMLSWYGSHAIAAMSYLEQLAQNSVDIPAVQQPRT
jgi:ABC-type Fe3+-hydroxamate transport system substrate-binding protein